MTGDKQVAPDPEGDPEGEGSATFRIVAADRICGTFLFTTTTDEPNGPSVVILTHIHTGAADVGGGPIVANFSPVNLNNEVCVTAGAAILDQIKANPAGFYANTHTNNFPGGAVRAQLAPDNS